VTAVHPIEAESYRILEQLADLSPFGPLARAVVARVVHATADLDYVESLVVEEDAVRSGVEALRAGAPVACDVEMVRAGISGTPTCCHLADVGEATAGRTRTAEAMARAAAHHPQGAVVVVGCAPTALAEVVRLAGEGRFRPALVVGLPVGFVGAVEAKEALRASGLPAVSNVGEKGGSAAAAAAVNALVRLAAAPAPGTEGRR
jgi:precorrin-8X/cobalt-precorrin-8 methylmutase